MKHKIESLTYLKQMENLMKISAPIWGASIWQEMFFSASKGYDLLKELNLGALRDKDLRVLLTQYYERDIALVHREYADDKLEFENFWLPYVRRNFKEWEFGNYAVPHDYSRILDDQILLTATKMNTNNLNNTIRAYNSALSTVMKLIQQLPD